MYNILNAFSKALRARPFKPETFENKTQLTNPKTLQDVVDALGDDDNDIVDKYLLVRAVKSALDELQSKIESDKAFALAVRSRLHEGTTSMTVGSLLLTYLSNDTWEVVEPTPDMKRYRKKLSELEKQYEATLSVYKEYTAAQSGYEAHIKTELTNLIKQAQEGDEDALKRLKKIPGTKPTFKLTIQK